VPEVAKKPLRYLMQKYPKKPENVDLLTLLPGHHPEMTSKELEKNEEDKEINELRDFWTDKENLRVFAELAGHFMALESMVEIGLRPLEGICPLCPTNIRIGESKNKVSQGLRSES
jgi:cobyrinic acid a,c-diamide synthase